MPKKKSIVAAPKRGRTRAESILTPALIAELVAATKPLPTLPDNRKLIGVELRGKLALLEPLKGRGWRDNLCQCHIAIRRALDLAWSMTEFALEHFRKHEMEPDAVLPLLDELAGKKGYGGVRSGGLFSAAESALAPATLGELQTAYLKVRQEPGSAIVAHYAASCAHEAALHFARGVRNRYERSVSADKDPAKQLEIFCRFMVDEPAIDHAALVASMEMETAEASLRVKLPDDRKPLGRHAKVVYEKLISLPAHEALTGPAILKWLAEKRSAYLDDKQLHRDVIKPLEPWGLKKDAPKIGYYIPPSARPGK